MDFGRPVEYRHSPEFERAEYYRDNRTGFPQRSRSQTRLDPEFIPAESFYGRPVDKALRSKSLDYRDALRDDQAYESRKPGVTIPIRQEKKERQYDYGRETFVPVLYERDLPDQRDRGVDVNRGYGRDRDTQYASERIPRNISRSSDQLDRRVYDDRDRKFKLERQSPKSVSSNRNIALNQSFDVNRTRRADQFGDQRPADDYAGYVRGDEQRDRYRNDWKEAEDRRRDKASGRQHHHSYQYESHGESPPRRIISQQPHGMSPPSHGAPIGPAPHGSMMLKNQPSHFQRPQQYHRIKCCCFTLTWPPWSYEQTAPPQPIYKNI